MDLEVSRMNITSTFMSVVKRHVSGHPGLQGLPSRFPPRTAACKHHTPTQTPARLRTPDQRPSPQLSCASSRNTLLLLDHHELKSSSQTSQPPLPANRWNRPFQNSKSTAPGSHSNSSTSPGYTYFWRKVATIQSLSIFQAPHLSSELATSSEECQLTVRISASREQVAHRPRDTQLASGLIFQTCAPRDPPLRSGAEHVTSPLVFWEANLDPGYWARAQPVSTVLRRMKEQDGRAQSRHRGTCEGLSSWRTFTVIQTVLFRENSGGRGPMAPAHTHTPGSEWDGAGWFLRYLRRWYQQEAKQWNRMCAVTKGSS